MDSAITAAPEPDPISDADLDDAIAHLRSLNQHAFLDYVVAVGQYVARKFFNDDFAALHDKDPTKQASFKEFCRRRTKELEDLNLSPATLRRYLHATEVWHGLPKQVRERLGLDHLQRLSAVRDDQVRKQLAHEAADLKWTREQVSLAVAKFKQEQRKGGKKPGRKPKPQALKLAVAMHAAVKRLRKAREAIGRLDGKQREEWEREVREALGTLRATLDLGRVAPRA